MQKRWVQGAKRAASLVLLVAPVWAGAQTLTVEIGHDRSPATTELKAQAAVRQFAANVATLTRAHRDRLVRAGRMRPEIAISFPTRVEFASQGQRLPLVRNGSRAPGGLVLAFDASGPHSFPPSYRALLQSVFDQAQGTMNAVFGQPAVGGTVHVRNFDADIFDREAVAGGYYVPNNGSGEQEIRFPIYLSEEAAAVNFLHTLLLAYIGPEPYGFDAFQEGLVRAATMFIARTPAAMPASLDQGVIEAVLEATYDVSPFYDWYNQRALGGPVFIAPNLRSVPLPAGGSLGGIYLMRYQMAGTAWQKVMAEHPGFVKAFNEAFYSNTAVRNDAGALGSLAQNVLTSLNPGNAAVEGLPFAAWAARQFILETDLTYGPKLHVAPIPIATQLSGPDFGVFDLVVTYFHTLLDGNEVLASGVSYPIFWDRDFNRIFTSAQEDQMPIAGAFGSVTPNFPNLYSGVPYRATVDIPVQDQLERVYLPAGAIATASSPLENDFYGTVLGLGLTSGQTATVSVFTSGGTALATNVPVRNGAFGTRIATSAFLGRGALLVRVFMGANEVLARRVNKGPGPLALDLRIGGDANQVLNLPKGLSALGFFVDPWESSIPAILGVSPLETLAARYNASRAAYDLYPSLEPFKIGHGYFVRLDAAKSLAVPGRLSPGTPTSTALRPGWNLISNPLPENTPKSRVTVVKAAEFPQAYSGAEGSDLGIDFFEFVPGPADAATGAPETGSMVAATSFEPGKAYYVRVMAAEGLTLLFSPATPLGPTRAPQVTAQASAAPRAGLLGGWVMKLSLEGLPVAAFIGQRPSATRGFDRPFDSELPPLMGGPQIWIENGSRLYRDTRSLGMRETYQVRLTGLVPGRRYGFRTAMVEGNQRSITIIESGRRRVTGPDGVHVFTPRSPTHTITIEAGGLR
ncbi:MAG TPA: hypothetical protein VM328_01655 [Fimbriimonadaceae bacterium]|nr:hypothetical protein [Fimbriimonadaceae bacterium]